MKAVIDRPVGNGAAKGHMAALIHGAHQFQVAKSSLQLRIQVRKRLRIVPHVRTGAVAAAAVGKTAFPSPQIPVLLAQNGRRFKNPEIRRDSVQHIGRRCRGENRVFELDSPRAQRGIVLLHVGGHIARVFPLRRVVRAATAAGASPATVRQPGCPVSFWALPA